LPEIQNDEKLNILHATAFFSLDIQYKILSKIPRKDIAIMAYQLSNLFDLPFILKRWQKIKPESVSHLVYRWGRIATFFSKKNDQDPNQTLPSQEDFLLALTKYAGLMMFVEYFEVSNVNKRSKQYQQEFDDFCKIIQQLNFSTSSKDLRAMKLN